MNFQNNNCFENVKLSVVVTFCNQSEFIKDALDSILRQQTEYSYEVLINLVSPDEDSRKILKEYTDKYPFIKLYETDNSQKDIPVLYKASLSRINALQHAQGEYFCLLDGDDFYSDSSRFQKLISFLEENKLYIGVFHDYQFFNNEKKTVQPAKQYHKTELSMDLNEYYEKSLHNASWCFIWRNIFLTKFPEDFDKNLFNDSYITAYMLRYGKIYYLPYVMANYRINIPSIHNSQSMKRQLANAVFFREKRHQLIPYEKNLLEKSILSYHRKYNSINLKPCDEREINLLIKTAKAENCYFTYNILNYKNLSFIKKINFLKNLYALTYLGIPYKKYKIYNLVFFSGRINLGDTLNLYVIQRLLKLTITQNVKTKNKKIKNLFAIGSIMDYLHVDIKTIKNHPTIIWGSGFIERARSDEYKKSYKNIKVIAMRGMYTRARLGNHLKNTLLKKPLGDPGLLASELVDTTKIAKTHKVGVVLHFVDKNSPYIKNIKLLNYKLIDIEKNPIQVIKEIAECDVILSSAMHGLIIADSLNIPNRRLILTNKLIGGNYKFDDYYSAYNMQSPGPIDLSIVTADENTIENIKKEYKELNLKPQIDRIKKELLNAAKQL